MTTVIVNMPQATPGCQCETCKEIRAATNPWKVKRWDDGRYPPRGEKP